nr:hypothetical protein [Tanacetum cinerariifolium]
MAAPGGANQIARRDINDLIEFSGETFVDGYMSFFKFEGRNELIKKIVGCVVDSGGVLELDPKEDENNHSNGNVVKRGITRLSKFHMEYGKPDGIKLSVTFDALNRISGSHGALFLSFLGDLVQEHIGLKILSWNKKETEDKTKEGTLKVDHGTDAMTVALGKEKGGYASGVGTGVTYKRYFDLPRSIQASDEIIMLLQSQLDNERRARQEKELEIQNLSNKMLETEGMISKLMNQLVAQGQQLQIISTRLTPSDCLWWTLILYIIALMRKAKHHEVFMDVRMMRAFRSLMDLQL